MNLEKLGGGGGVIATLDKNIGSKSMQFQNNDWYANWKKCDGVWFKKKT